MQAQRQTEPMYKHWHWHWQVSKPCDSKSPRTQPPISPFKFEKFSLENMSSSSTVDDALQNNKGVD